jgi:V/A-type H+-transporting ATPase subunit B
MKDAIGEGLTWADHPDLANQLYASYAHVQDVCDLADIIGEEELSKTDRRYLDFGQDFKRHFVSQVRFKHRGIEETLNIGWTVLGRLPVDQLTRLPRKLIGEHLNQNGND